MIAIAPLGHFEIGGRKLEVSLLDPDILELCNEIGQSIRLGRYRGDLVPWAVATLIRAMVVDKHPDVHQRDLVPHLTYLHFEQTANELARQLLLSLSTERMGKA